MTILDQLAAHAKERVALSMQRLPEDELRCMALSMTGSDFAFEKALRKEGLSFICECKKASPSKGIIDEKFDYLQIAMDYQTAGADCISVLTEPKWFLGSTDYLMKISAQVGVPCLRKDFTVSSYMIYEAKICGASAVLLICSILTPEQIKEYIHVADELGISALVEAHNEDEIKTALNCGARLIGVNNRNLSDFSVDTSNSRRLRDIVPPDVLFVSESGVQTAQDVKDIADCGADAVLIGEILMRASEKTHKLRELKSLL